MSLSPIPKVLSTFHRKRVRALVMGGQACILYGATEFTRDVDFAVAVAPGKPKAQRETCDSEEQHSRTVHHMGPGLRTDKIQSLASLAAERAP